MAELTHDTMTKAELIAELEEISKGWQRRADAKRSEWYSGSPTYYQAADELDELIARAKQTTDTTP